MILAFDVNETLLDLAPLDPLFEQALGSAALRQTWFSQMLQVAFVGGLTGRYVGLGNAGRAALAMVAAAQGVALEDDAAERITGELRRLPPHPDAAPALRQLRDAGFTLAALTNSTLAVAALAEGCAAAFVRRPGKVPSPLGDQPDTVGDDLHELADRIVAVDGHRR